MPRKGDPSPDRTSRTMAMVGLVGSTIATLVALLAWYGDFQNRSALEDIKVARLLDEAQDLMTKRIGETILQLRPALCARPHAEDARLEQARRKIDEALRYQPLPTNHRAYLLLALVLAHQGDYSGALEIIDEALTSVSDQHSLFAARGAIVFRLGQFRTSAHAFEIALELSPGNVEYQSSLGNVLQELGELERARRVLEDALRWDPSFVPAHINLGDLLRDQGSLDQALLHFQRAVLLEPNDADAHGHVGYTFALKGDLGEAVREFQAAIDRAPHCGQYFYNMGLVQRRLGNIEIGDHFVQRAKQLGIEAP